MILENLEVLTFDYIFYVSSILFVFYLVLNSDKVLGVIHVLFFYFFVFCIFLLLINITTCQILYAHTYKTLMFAAYIFYYFNVFLELLLFLQCIDNYKYYIFDLH